ncbi:MAG: response regulator, partial [Desulfobacteraceae bacterium]
LEGAGILVEIAANGEEALAALQRAPYDAVLMDIQMPRMDGYEATRRIRREPRFSSLPVIAMTAHAMKGDDEKCLAAGMDDYIAKPIQQDRLFRTLWKAVKGRAGPEGFAPHGRETPRSQAAPAPEGPDGGLPAALPGIRIGEALGNLAIDPASFRRILLGFARDNADTPARLTDLAARKDWRSLQQLAHRLNGSAANIGAAELKAAAQALETQCRAQAPDEAAIHRLQSALRQVLDSLQQLAGQTPGAPPASPSPPIDPQQLRPLVVKLAAALELADPEAIATHLQAVGRHLDSTRFQNLANQIAAYDYDEALKTLTGIADDLENPTQGK